MIPFNYVPVPYPKMKYHRFDGTQVVKSVADDIALGPEWKDAPIVDPDPPVIMPGITDEQAAELYGAKAKEVVSQVGLMSPDVETLQRVRAAEVANPQHAGGRKSVLAAIDARLAAIQVPA